MVEVTQADREAAASVLGGTTPDGLLDGRKDSLSIVQALAKHRQIPDTHVLIPRIPTDADIERVARAMAKKCSESSRSIDLGWEIYIDDAKAAYAAVTGGVE